MPKSKMGIDGFLNVNKHPGSTSFSIVAWLRRLTGEKRVGHTGTLDPLATGVLPVCFGQATRLIRFLPDGSRCYLAEIELGTATDTFDSEGEIVGRREPGGVTRSQLEEALSAFRGVIEQVPPVYSALKHHGRRYSELARAGVIIEPEPRQVEITSLELLNYEMPVVTVKVECSKGTYIRSLASDLGRHLGCGAYLKSLTRLRCGHFRIEQSLTLADIEAIWREGKLGDAIVPIDGPLDGLRAVVVDAKDQAAISSGRSIALEEDSSPVEPYCRAYSQEGRFIAVLRFVSGEKAWHPERVLTRRI